VAPRDPAGTGAREGPARGTTSEHTEGIAPPAPWHTLATDETCRALDTAPEGLSGDEARHRLERYGPNEVEIERETPWWVVLLRQFRDPLIYILLAAAFVTLVLRDFVDTGVIFAVVTVLLLTMVEPAARPAAGVRRAARRRRAGA